jgi:hypothetical protein
MRRKSAIQIIFGHGQTIFSKSEKFMVSRKGRKDFQEGGVCGEAVFSKERDTNRSVK